MDKIEVKILLIYILGAVLTYIFIYGFYVRKYKKENTAIKFKYWIDDKFIEIIVASIVWFITIPLYLLYLPIKIISKLIEKYYKV